MYLRFVQTDLCML